MDYNLVRIIHHLRPKQAVLNHKYMASIRERILILQMEVSSLEREYRNPLMWIFFAKSIKREINHKKDLIGHYENLLAPPVF